MTRWARTRMSQKVLTVTEERQCRVFHSEANFSLILTLTAKKKNTYLTRTQKEVRMTEDVIGIWGHTHHIKIRDIPRG